MERFLSATRQWGRYGTAQASSVWHTVGENGKGVRKHEVAVVASDVPAGYYCSLGWYTASGNSVSSRRPSFLT